MHGIYYVSNLGRVKRDGRILKPWISSTGYACLKLTNGLKVKRCKVHRLVAESFRPNPNQYKCVNHINGIKTDNRAVNLEWCTSSQNNIHAVETGLRKMPKGESHALAKKVIDTSTGVVYPTIRDASEATGIKRYTLVSYLLGTRKNRTTLKYAN
jgi:hypothetical protein